MTNYIIEVTPIGAIAHKRPSWQHHPEQQEDEIYMGNARPSDVHKSSWRSSRLGMVALMRDGQPVHQMTGSTDHYWGERLYPWFISVREVQALIEQLSHREVVPFGGTNDVALFQRMVDTQTVFD